MTEVPNDIALSGSSTIGDFQGDRPTEKQVSKFDMLRPMIDAAYREMGELSKKKQDGIVNELKVRHINRLLVPVKEILASDESVMYLELLDEDSLPQNSDAVFILGQFRAAMEQFRQRHSSRGGWITAELVAEGADEDDLYYENQE
jgi:hypothetical protein